jgi:hypothetical protein
MGKPNSKQRRARRRKAERRAAAQRSLPVWDEVELTFFAAAPPDEPEAAAAPDTFEDLVPAAPSPELGWAQGLLAAVRAAFRRGATNS